MATLHSFDDAREVMTMREVVVEVSCACASIDRRMFGRRGDQDCEY